MAGYNDFLKYYEDLRLDDGDADTESKDDPERPNLQQSSTQASSMSRQEFAVWRKKKQKPAQPVSLEDEVTYNSSLALASSASPSPVDAQEHFRDLRLPKDSRPIILFSLQGLLTSSSNWQNIRPGVERLKALKAKFRLGVYTAAPIRKMSKMLASIESAASAGSKKDTSKVFDDNRLVLSRSATAPLPVDHRKDHALRKESDVVKPLAQHFSRLDNVLVIDDDLFKATKSEEDNVLIISTCQGEETDKSLHLLTKALLKVGQKAHEKVTNLDMRTVAKQIGFKSTRRA